MSVTKGAGDLVLLSLEAWAVEEHDQEHRGVSIDMRDTTMEVTFRITRRV
jgi:hypothetical protein